jgi:hypothetical protein
MSTENDPVRARREHDRLIADLEQDIAAKPLVVETDLGAVLEPKTPNVPAQPGWISESRAAKYGSEDEYSNRMRTRYGDEW